MKVLLVDDSGLARRRMRQMLESDGYEVIEAEDGMVALERYFVDKPDLVLLDNMTPDLVARCVERAGGKVKLEVSGGVNQDILRAYAETGVDRISVGALTHSAPAADINFLIEPL